MSDDFPFFQWIRSRGWPEKQRLIDEHRKWECHKNRRCEIKELCTLDKSTSALYDPDNHQNTKRDRNRKERTLIDSITE